MNILNKETSPAWLKYLVYLLKWIALSVPLGFVIGSLVAFFLWLLTSAILFRFSHNYLLYLLPFAGVAIHFAYKLWGRSSEKGNILVMDEIHKPGGGIPPQMAPLVLVTTVITHLFGGSAGREGTAVQIGGSIAQMFGNWLKLSPADIKILLMAGVAAGFGAVFGTPLTGAVFAIEVVTLGRLKYNAVVPCMFASLVGDLAVDVWGVAHTHYQIDFIASDSALMVFSKENLLLILKIVIASVAFGLVSYLFATMTHHVKSFFASLFKTTWLIPFFGGVIVILLTFLVSKPDYLSLGADAEYTGAITIVSAFKAGGADTLSWLWKTVFTTITLGSGFKGGEVTPLFYIGATLGNTLATFMNAPISLFAALGFVAVFAGATKTPLACTFMSVEIFGGEYILFFVIACFVAYFCSGHLGIYNSDQFSGAHKNLVTFQADEIAKTENDSKDSFFKKKFGKYRI